MAAGLASHPGWRPLSRRDDPTYEAPFHGLPRWLTGSLLDWMAPRLRRRDSGGSVHYDVALVRELERRIIIKVLHAHNWNRKKAAKSMSISYRALLYKIQEAGIVSSRLKAVEQIEESEAVVM